MACEQAWMFGAHLVFAQPVAGLESQGEEHVVRLPGGHRITARAVILATGVASAVGDGATAVRLVHEYLAARHEDARSLAVGA